MRILVSVLFALVGSVVGGVLRAGLKVAEDRVVPDPDAPPEEVTINITASPAAALAGGVVGIVIGPSMGFWAGVALGAAGMERFDMKLLGKAGIDVEALVQRARSMAEGSTEAPNEAAPELA